MNTFIVSVVAFLFAIGVLVAVHEWGHYIVARLAGVKVLRFSIGFGKPLWLRRAGPDETEYCVSSIPLGGYVKLLDEREGDVDKNEVHRAFNRQPVSARIAILVAGPLMNFVFAILAYWSMFVIGVPGLQPIVGTVADDSIAATAGVRYEDRIVQVGEQAVATWEGTVLALLDQLLASDQIRLSVVGADGQQRQVTLNVAGKVSQLTEPGRLFTGLGLSPWSPELEARIGELTPGEAAEKAGLLPGDLILAADGQPVADWTEWVMFVRERPGETVKLSIQRDGRPEVVSLKIGSVAGEDGVAVGRIGAGVEVADDFYDQYQAEQRYGAISAVGVAIKRTWSMSELTVRMVSRMVTGDVSVKNISGPINIAQYAGYSASVGIASFLNFLAVVSLSLGIINLLPIPVLDGGQVIYQIAEGIKGKPLSERAQIIGQQIGIFVLMIVMGFAFYNDLVRVFS